MSELRLIHEDFNEVISVIQDRGSKGIRVSLIGEKDHELTPNEFADIDESVLACLCWNIYIADALRGINEPVGRDDGASEYAWDVFDGSLQSAKEVAQHIVTNDWPPREEV